LSRESRPKPPAVKGLKIVNIFETVVNISWNRAVSADNIVLSVFNDDINTLLIGPETRAPRQTSTSYAGLIPNTNYSFFITARNSFGFSPAAKISFTTLGGVVPPNGVPPTPTVIVSEVTETTAKIQASVPSGPITLWVVTVVNLVLATQIQFEVTTSNNASSITTFLSSGRKLLPNTNYRVAVAAKNQSGFSAQAGAVQFTTLDTIIPPQPCEEGFERNRRGECVPIPPLPCSTLGPPCPTIFSWTQRIISAEYKGTSRGKSLFIQLQLTRVGDYPFDTLTVFLSIQNLAGQEIGFDVDIPGESKRIMSMDVRVKGVNARSVMLRVDDVIGATGVISIKTFLWKSFAEPFAIANDTPRKRLVFDADMNGENGDMEEEPTGVAGTAFGVAAIGLLGLGVLGALGVGKKK